LDELRNDAKVVYQDELMKQDGVTRVPGVVRHFDENQAFKLRGDLDIGGLKEQSAIRETIPYGDKLEEYKFFNRYAPGSMGESVSVADILKELGYRGGSRKLTDKQMEKFLPKLQEELRARFPKGFLLKDTQSSQSGGVFPKHTDDLTALNKLYKERDLGNMFDQRMKGIDNAAAMGPVYRDMQQEPGWAGRVLSIMQRSPEHVLAQEMLPIERKTGLRGSLADLLENPRSQEVRVHVERGQAIPELAMSRYDPLMHVFERDKLHGAAEFAQSIVDKLPAKYRNSNFGMDIAPMQGGGYRMIESNPSARSGVIRQHPIGSELLARQLTGRWSAPVSALGGGVAAAGGGAAGYLGGKALQARQQQQQQQQQQPLQDLKQTPLT
jgi:hypothetical protein